MNIKRLFRRNKKIGLRGDKRLGINWWHSEFNQEIDKNAGCNRYGPTDVELESKLALIPNKKNKVLLDAGCGAGYILHYCSGVFEKVIGIEFIPELANLAKEYLTKIQKYGKRGKWSVLQSDVRHVPDDIIDCVDVFFLYNPFSGQVMESFVDKIIASIDRKDRDVYVIYVNNVCRDMFIKHKDVFCSRAIWYDTVYWESEMFVHHANKK